MLRTLRMIAKGGIASEPPPHRTLPQASDVLPGAGTQVEPQVQALQHEIRRTLGRALCIREVDAGSCNACELEIHALQAPRYNLEGYGIKFVASPRHADALMVTGPLSRNMLIALQRTWQATPEPKLLIALGDCACDGGLFKTSPACLGALEQHFPVDLRVPGCPPEPVAILRGLLELVRR